MPYKLNPVEQRIKVKKTSRAKNKNILKRPRYMVGAVTTVKFINFILSLSLSKLLL